MTLRVPAEDDGRGRLTVRGARYLLVRPETLVALQKALEEVIGPRAAECLAAGGRAGGARAAASVDGPARARVERLLETGATIGWGELSLERLSERELVVVVRHSPFAEAYGASAAPVCHLIRGVLESLAAAVLERPSRVVETACAAMGADACRFATADGPVDRAVPPAGRPGGA